MRTYSKRFRLWHWLFALSIFIVSITVFIREFLLNSHAIADLLNVELTNLGLVLSEDKLRELSHLITGDFWDFHIYFGYVFAFFLLLRIIMIIKNGFSYPKEVNKHKKLVYASYKILYIVLFIIASCGIILHLGEVFSWDEDSLWLFEELHGIFAWLVIIFIPLHIAGVIISDIKEDKGLVSRIISGSK